MMKYISTRGQGEPQSFEQVLLSGLAPDGGLYVPERWPAMDIAALRGLSYIDLASAVMYPFVEGCIDTDDFKAIIAQTYASDVFRHADVVPLHPLTDNHYILEQFHGPTIAFKDVALQLLGRLFDHVLDRRGEHITIVGATSGDTGSAAIEGCRHSNHLDIFILHPKGRVSDVQRKQMTTIDAPNVHNIAIEGSFDDCQSMVKAMFADAPFRDTVQLAAVNSINWARIMAQIVYYFHAAFATEKYSDAPPTFIVPTGNFGNVFAGYCAKMMGLDINLVVATNENDILARFFQSGEMVMNGSVATLSPSMDIEISSNFERFLFDAAGRNSVKVRAFMADFSANGCFAPQTSVLDYAHSHMNAYKTNDADTIATIKSVYEATGYTLDPHSAVGFHVAQDVARDTAAPVITLATAHPAKFPDAVEQAIGERPALPDHLSDLFDRKEYFDTLPNDLKIVQDFVLQHRSSKESIAS